MSKPRVKIEQTPGGYYRVYKKKSHLFGLISVYEYTDTAYSLETAKEIAMRVLNPIVKEYE